MAIHPTEQVEAGLPPVTKNENPVLVTEPAIHWALSISGPVSVDVDGVMDSPAHDVRYAIGNVTAYVVPPHDTPGTNPPWANAVEIAGAEGV